MAVKPRESTDITSVYMKKIWGLFSGSAADDEGKLPWHPLEDLSQLDAIRAESNQRPQLIFKHSTRCGISAVMLRRLEKNWETYSNTADFYLLDLLAHRDISREIETWMDLPHQSPQVLLIEKGELRRATSHSGIAYFLPEDE